MNKIVYTTERNKIYACEIIDCKKTIFGKRYLLKLEEHNCLTNKEETYYIERMWFDIWKTS